MEHFARGQLLLLHVVLLYLVLAWTAKQSAYRFNLEIFGINCRNYTAALMVFNCSVRELAPNQYSFDHGFVFREVIEGDFEIVMQAEMQIPHSKQALRILDLTIDACQTLRMSSLLMRSLLKEARRTSSFPLHCPFDKDAFYKLENFTLTPATFPPYIPDSNITFVIDFFLKNVLIGKTVTKSRIYSKRYSTPRKHEIEKNTKNEQLTVVA